MIVTVASSTFSLCYDNDLYAIVYTLPHLELYNIHAPGYNAVLCKDCKLNTMGSTVDKRQPVFDPSTQ